MSIRYSQFDNGDAKLSTLSVPMRGRGVRRTKKEPSGIGIEIERIRERCGMTRREFTAEMQKEMAEILGNPGYRLLETTLHAWVYGSVPRRIGEGVVKEAIRRIDARFGDVNFESTWTPSEEVKAKVLEWRETMSVKQIAVAADESVQLISAWAAGKHAVLTRRWKQVVERVERVREVLRLAKA